MFSQKMSVFMDDLIVDLGTSFVAQKVRNPPTMQEIWGQFLGQEDPLEKGNSNPLQYSCLGNPMDRGAW